MSYPKTPEELAIANEELAAAIVQRNISTLQLLDKRAEQRLDEQKLENKKHRRYLTIVVCVQIACVILQAVAALIGK